VQIDNNGQGFIGSTSVLGIVLDSLTLKKYLSYTDSLFPANIDWMITGRLNENDKCLHAIKTGGKDSLLSILDIDSIFATPRGANGLLGISDATQDLVENSTFWIEITLKTGLDKSLSDKTYSILIKSDKNEYSGSIVDFENNPNQLITIGEMDKNDFIDLKNKFKDRIKILK